MLSAQIVAVIRPFTQVLRKVATKAARLAKRFATSRPEGPLEQAIFMHLDGILNVISGQFLRRTFSVAGGI